MSDEIKCERCGTIVNRVMDLPDMHGENVLNIKISGSYAQFIDDDMDGEPEQHTRIKLCHKCGHEFMTSFMGVPAGDYSYWHPHSGDDYCEGWRYA